MWDRQTVTGLEHILIASCDQAAHSAITGSTAFVLFVTDKRVAVLLPT